MWRDLNVVVAELFGEYVGFKKSFVEQNFSEKFCLTSKYAE